MRDYALAYNEALFRVFRDVSALWLVLTIDLLEHAKHVLHVTVIQEPDLWIPVVLFIRHCGARVTPSSQICKRLQSHHRQMLCA